MCAGLPVVPYNTDALLPVVPCVCTANDKSRAVVRLRNVMMELRKVVNHPVLLGLQLDTPAYTRAVEARKARAAAAVQAKGGCLLGWGGIG